MITGYVDEKENVFCSAFWVVDNCVLCGAEVRCKDIKLLA
jgi:hypothetical protein